MSNKFKTLMGRGEKYRRIEKSKYKSVEWFKNVFGSLLNIFNYSLSNNGISSNNKLFLHSPIIHSNNVNNTSKIPSFTLSEVLISISIIGVIAAITIPIVIPLIQERIDSYRHSNIVHKITQATDVMKALGKLGHFDNTDDFVDELEKHLKIIKRCDSENIEECWPTATVIGSDGQEYYVKNAKTRKDLGFNNDKNNKNVGLILNDGASIILTYNSEAEEINPTDETKSTSIELPIGGGYKNFFAFTTNSTSGLAMVMDVNGAKKPNSETIGEKFHDIRNLNGATFATCAGTTINGKCYTKISSYSALDCQRNSAGNLNRPANAAYCDNTSYYASDKWAGARKACANIDSELPSAETLNSICSNYKSKLGITGGTYWSSTIYSKYVSKYVYFKDCRIQREDRTYSLNLLCVK